MSDLTRKAYLIVDITISDPEAFKEYVARVPAIIDKHQGQYLVRGGAAEVKEGDWQPQRLIVLEFPSRANAEAFLQDPAYAPVAALRHQAAHTDLVMVEGYER